MRVGVEQNRIRERVLLRRSKPAACAKGVEQMDGAGEGGVSMPCLATQTVLVAISLIPHHNAVNKLGG